VAAGSACAVWIACLPPRRQIPPEVFWYAFSEEGVKSEVWDSRLHRARIGIGRPADRRATRQIAANRGKVPRPPNA